jgi:putative addiction module component (TIGR02574 family)
MTPTETELREARELIDRAMRLSPIARESIAFELLDSLHGPSEDPEEVRKAWKAEIARRIEAVRNGTMKTYTLEETMEYLRKVVDEGRPA